MAVRPNGSLLRDTTRWLVDFRIIDESSLENNEWETLARKLKNGASLCILLYNIEPTLIDIYQVCKAPSKSESLSMKNIDLFTKTCLNKLNLTWDQMFQPDDLYYMNNFGSVLLTLAAVSRTEIALRHHEISEICVGADEEIDQELKEYVYEMYTETSASSKHYDESFIYSDTEENNYAWQSMFQSRLTDDYESQDYSEIEDESNRTENEVCEFGLPIVRPHNQPLLISHLPHRELLTSEHKYLILLLELRTTVWNKLLPRLGKPDTAKILYRIEALTDVHTQLYHELILTYPHNPKDLKDVFHKYKNKIISIYSDYCSMYNENRIFYTETLEKHADIRLIVEEWENSSKKPSVVSSLAAPVQRILKYHLLVEKIIKYLKDESGSWDNTQTIISSSFQAVEYLSATMCTLYDINNFIDVAVGDKDFLNIFKTTIENFYEIPQGFKEFTESGRLVLDAQVHLKYNKGPKVKGYLIIFQEGIFICQESNTGNAKFKFLKLIWVKNLLLTFIESDLAFILKDGSTNTTVFCHTASNQRREDIIQAINSVTKNHGDRMSSNHDLRPVTIKLCEVEQFECTLQGCLKPLKGIYAQAYECKFCKLQWHAQCVGIRNTSCFSKSTKSWCMLDLKREEAKQYIMARSSGSFIIRWSAEKDQLVMTVNGSEKVHHLFIDCSARERFQLRSPNSNAPKFRTLEELIAYYRVHNVQESIPNVDVTLHID